MTFVLVFVPHDLELGGVPAVSPSREKFFSDFSDVWYVHTGRRVMHDGMPCDPIQGQDHGASEVPKIALFKVYLLRHLQRSWQMSTNS